MRQPNQVFEMDVCASSRRLKAESVKKRVGGLCDEDSPNSLGRQKDLFQDFRTNVLCSTYSNASSKTCDILPSGSIFGWTKPTKIHGMCREWR